MLQMVSYKAFEPTEKISTENQKIRQKKYIKNLNYMSASQWSKKTTEK